MLKARQVFDDKTFILKNNKSSADVCSSSKNYGCFNISEPTEEYNLDTNYFCEKINLSESPGFKIGAWVKKTTGTENVRMFLYNLDGEELSSCELEQSSITIPGSEISCDIDYLVKQPTEYYVCVYSDGDGYKIKGNSKDKCGFPGEPIKNEVASYQIFAQERKFDSFGTLNVENSLDGKDSLNTLIKNYIYTKYGSLDCSTTDCIVPVKFSSGKDTPTQSITLENLKINYEKSAGEVTENNFYKILKEPSTITAGFQKLYLEKSNFSVPDSVGDHSLELTFMGIKIFNDFIVVKAGPKIVSLTPLKTASAFPTSFELKVDSSDLIEKYLWDFGDGQTKTTTINKSTHTYNSTGQYNLSITIVDFNKKNSSKIFKINVTTPKEQINQELTKKLADLSNIKTQISKFDVFTQERINSFLNLSQIETKLNSIKVANKSASSEEDYNKIIQDLFPITVPESIEIKSKGNSLLFYPLKENVDLFYLEEVSGKTYDIDKEEKYINSILGWNTANIETKISFSKFLIEYDSTTKESLSIFEMRITKEDALNYTPYLIIEQMENLNFKENPLKSQQEDFFYTSLVSSPKTITFSTTEEIVFTDLPMFIAPDISKLDLISNEFGDFEPDKSPFMIVILIIVLFIVIASMIYIAIHAWYKKKYEDYLFKNRNNLYNLIKYIDNAKKQGVPEKEMIRNLKEAKWKSEQIKYALKKYSGKNVGMVSPRDLFKKKQKYTKV